MISNNRMYIMVKKMFKKLWRRLFLCFGFLLISKVFGEIKTIENIHTSRDVSSSRIELIASSRHAPEVLSFSIANVLSNNLKKYWESERGILSKREQVIEIKLDEECKIDALRYYSPMGWGGIMQYEIRAKVKDGQYIVVAEGNRLQGGGELNRIEFSPIETIELQLIIKSAEGNTAIIKELRIESAEPLPFKKANLNLDRDISVTRMAITASSSHAPKSKYFKPGSMVDNSLESYWESERGILSKREQVIEIKLDEECEIDALRCYAPKNRGFISQYEVKAKVDGDKLISLARGNWVPQIKQVNRVGFYPIKTKEIHLVIHSAEGNTAIVNEIKLESSNPLRDAPEAILSAVEYSPEMKRAFEDRHSSKSIEGIAKELSLFIRKGSTESITYENLYQQGDFLGAVNHFNTAFTKRLVDRKSVLEHTESLEEDNVPAGKMMLHGIFKNHDGKYLGIGQPGSINWKELYSIFKDEVSEPIFFKDLLVAAKETGEMKYLEKWGEFIDDHSLFENTFNDLNAVNSPPKNGQLTRLVHLLHYLKDLEVAQPGLLGKLPPSTLPRMLMDYIPNKIALNHVYFSSYVGNWYPENCLGQVVAGLMLDDLLQIDVPLIERGIMGLRRYGVRCNLPDGTEVEPSWGYNNMFLKGAIPTLNLLKEHEVEIAKDTRIKEIYNDILKRFRYRASMLTFDKQEPLIFRADGRTHKVIQDKTGNSLLPKQEEFGSLEKKVLGDKEFSRIYRAHLDIPEPKNTLGSIYYPYSGYAMIRQNWTKEGQYAFMMSRPDISAFGTRGVTDNLNIGIHAFGHDLLVDGISSLYKRSSSQLSVDGLDQYNLYDLNNAQEPRTVSYLTNAWKRPSNSLWIHNESFDYTEGVYEGLYRSKYPKKIDDISHKRQLIFARSAEIWIAVDRVKSKDRKRIFSWHWKLPCSDKEEKILTFKPSEIKIDEVRNRVYTTKPDSVNLTMQTFSQTPFTYARKNSFKSKTDTTKVCLIQSRAKRAKEVLALTAILPRKEMELDLSDSTHVSNEEYEGFSLKTPNGAIVRCLSARNGQSKLQIGSLRANAQMMLSVEKEGNTEVLILGANHLAIKGRKHSLQTANLVIRLDVNGQVLTSESIHSAIEPVVFSPQERIFVNSQKVTMRSPTNGVEIRYTLDGSEPSRMSPLYSEPLLLDNTTEIRAKAFRVGRESPAYTTDFTLDSVESSALYEKVSYLPSVSLQTSAGLNYSYYEGNWQKLFFNSELVDPVSTGSTTELFDLTTRKNRDTFSFIYEGYINVPKSDIYTFHAPLEWFDIRSKDAGYDLHLQIGGHDWKPAMDRQVMGHWSLALEKGLHHFRLKWVDYRGDEIKGKLFVSRDPRGIETAEIKINHEAWKQPYTFKDMVRALIQRRNGAFVWVGPPSLELSSPGLKRQAIPKHWFHKMDESSK